MKTPKEKEVSVEKLKSRLTSIAREKAFLVNEEKEIQSALREKLQKPFTDELKAMGKESGEITLQVDDVKVKMEIRKTVTWDSDELYIIAREMGPENAVKIMTIEASMPESNYNKIPVDSKWWAAITSARTVKYSEPKFSFPTQE
jgi:hypothetical protein